MSEKENTSELLIAEILMKMRAIESVLISKGIITKEEYFAEFDRIGKDFTKAFLKAAKVDGDLEDISNDVFKAMNKDKN